MFIRRNLFLFILALGLFTCNTFAQTETSAQSAQAATPAAVTATTVESGGVRFAAPANTVQLRLELYAAGGERVFDSGARQGSVLDWRASDAPQGVGDGSYLCVLTVKDLQGRASQRIGALSLQSGQASVQRVREQELPDAQKQAAAASRREQKSVAAGEDNGLTILRGGKQRALTVAAHDGQDGSVTSTTGALSLRTGDIFSGLDRERMRITPEGRVGVGTDKPEATLDVAGTIRARGGILFADGTVLTSAAQAKNGTPGVATLVAPAEGGTASLAGTGTANRLTKWIDNVGTLGDSALTEVGGNIGLGTPTPNSKLHVVGRIEMGAASGAGVNPTINNPNNIAGFAQFQFYPSAGTNTNMSFAVVPKGTGVANNRAQFSVFGTDFTADSTNYEFASVRARGNDFVFGTGKSGTGQNRPIMLSAGYLTDNATNNGQLYLDTTGRVGVGTTTPQSKLDVNGSLRLTGAGSTLTFPDGSSISTANTVVGGTPSGSSIVNAINDPATSSAISDARLSGNVARLNGANAWSGANVFGAGLSANNALVTNVGNPVNAGDATNKAYVDANTVRFVPGAEQLSVGDANGTAAMINLRGGSTCCSGPGGHTPAFFKVFQNGSFVATGNLGIGTSPLEGKGYRTSWHTYKGAFRSGYADNEWDDANTGFFSWAGGSNSTASGLYALAFGDTNFAESTSSIVFGSGNQVKGAAGFSAGAGNRVCDTYGVAFGNKAQSGGPLINGKCDPDSFNIRGLAAIALGYNVTADQDHTTAMGKFATNNGFSGTFIWSDGSATASADTFRNTANNEFALRATGGFRFRTNLSGTTGCNLPAGSGVFNCTSSRTTKENFILSNGEDVIARLRKIPVSTWNYTSEGSQVRHIGPMAEDFYQEFGLGTGNTSIGVQDLAGVSLAAVKALDRRTAQLQQRTAEVEQLRSEVQALRAANAGMEQRLATLERSMQQQQTPRPRATPRRRR
jgi:hypothetical protein